MGTITITVEAGAAGTTAKAFTVTNANIARLADFGKALYLVPGEPPATTNAEGLERWMRWAMEMSKVHLLANERSKAAIADFEAT